jgi:hypothetical protein
LLLLSQFVRTEDGSSRRRACLSGASLCADLRSTGTCLPAIAVRDAVYGAAGYERIRAWVLGTIAVDRNG